MRVIRVFVCLFVFALAVNSFAVLPTRTWVSNVGDDAYPCSFTAPCKTFAGAYSKTEVGGMISVEGPGAYGGLTINKSITIDGSRYFASVLYPLGDGITVNFTADDGLGNNVVLRGLSISSSYGGGYGVMVNSTKTVNVHIVDTTFTHTAVAVGVGGTGQGCMLRMDNVEASNLSSSGLVLSPAAGTPLKISLNNVRIGDGNQASSFAAGVRIGSNTNGTIANSVFQNSYHGILIESSNVHVTIAKTVLSENTGSGLHHNVSGITTVLDG